jgi:hypothetical protein
LKSLLLIQTHFLSEREQLRLYRPNYDIWDKIMRKSLPDKGLRWFLADKNESLAEIVVQQGFQNK